MNAVKAAPHLALVPLAGFVGSEDGLHLLGVWCRSHPRWAKCPVVDTPYPDTKTVSRAARQVQALYDKILPMLGQRLNALHGTDYGPREWRILAGPWLQLFLGAVYDRYLRLRCALDQLPDLQTILLADSASQPIGDTLELAYALAGDQYNLQLMSRLLRALGYAFPEQTLPRLECKPAKPSLRQAAIGRVSRLALRLRRTRGRCVLLRDSYLPRPVELRMAAETGGRVFPYVGAIPKIAPSSPRAAMRARLEGIDFGDTEFGRCLAHLVPVEIPSALVEDFGSHVDAARRGYPGAAAAVCSANAWHYDEIFKHAAVKHLRNGAELLGVQHGGNYGALELMLFEEHEIAVVDRYYTWGWIREAAGVEVKAMPAAKLLQRTRLRADNSLQKCLWGTTAMPRYLVTYPFTPEAFEAYLDWQSRFLTSLTPDVLARLRLRPHYEDYGWHIVDRLEQRVRGLERDDWRCSFPDSLARSRIYICDHLSTTFLEALSSGKPTLLFWSERDNKLRPEAVSYFQGLRNAGVLFHSPEEAAAELQCAARDVEAWWSESKVSAVGTFCQRFARTDASGFQIWRDEFEDVLGRQRSRPCPPSR